MKTWNVHCEGRFLGTVEENTEELASCAALSKFALTADAADAQDEQEQPVFGIAPDWAFSVTPA
jgi:hypothetical protein